MNNSSKQQASNLSQTRYVFWTSGWDSTYMVIKLLRDGYTVQPIYLLYPKRKSREYELRALDQLSQLISERVKPGKLLPYKVFSTREVRRAPEVCRALRVIRRQNWWLGDQYCYLAEFAKQHHDEFPVISLGIEKVPSGKSGGAHNTIDHFGKMGDNFRIIPSESSPEIVALFGNYDFPICDTSEVETLQRIKDWGYEDIMRHIWFCHRPIAGQPCGFCPPCFQKVASNMSFLLSEEALARHDRFYAIQQKHGKHVKKLCDVVYHIFHH